jgi:FkbM family methyltransferase
MIIDNIIQSLNNPPVRSHSDLKQDLVAMAVSGWRQGGYFVEFGAMDGVYASNTVLLETVYGWSGILAEPARCWHNALPNNRRCLIDYRAVARESAQELRFKETDIQLGFSGLTDYFEATEMHTANRLRSSGSEYMVTTVSLNDLLNQHHAPKVIDYVSMDTEGSELAILEGFDFSQHRVNLWTIEHNYVESTRHAILDIMTHNGYQRILSDRSVYDDWYIPC